MSATRPKRSPCCGRSRRRRAPEIDDGTLAHARAVERLALGQPAEAPAVLARMLDHLDASGRFALLKLATGALRVGISARLAKQALADAFGLDVEAVEEVWHGLAALPELFDWAEGRGPQPTARDVPVFRPFMLAHPLEETRVSLDDYAAEWKWDGIRVQLVHAGGETRLYSRTGDDISGSFPDIAEAFATRRRCSTASCWCAARGVRRKAARRPASTRSSSGLGARPSAPRCSADISRPSFGSTTYCSTARRICARWPWTERRARPRGVRRRARSRSIRPVGTDRGRPASRRWRR